MNLVIFDFCETLVPFQSADAFISFVLSKNKSKRKKNILQHPLLDNKVTNVFFNKFFPKYNFNKRKVLSQIRGYKIEELELLAVEYAENLSASIIPELMEKFNFHKSCGDEIIIISGGYEIYLKHFSKEFGFDACYATKMGTDNNLYTGKFDGNDCMFAQKVKYAEQYKSKMKEQPEKTVVYTDSESDLELMKWADEGIVVSKTPQQWAKNYNFNEIIWK